MKISMLPKEQQMIIENYKKKNNLTWKEMAQEFSIGESTLRYFFRKGLRPLPKFIYDEVSSKKSAHIKFVNKEFSPRKKHSRKSRASMISIRRKYGKYFFSEIGRKGSFEQKCNFKWTPERRMAQSGCGRKGGFGRVSSLKCLTRQERAIMDENKNIGISFKTNHFIDKNNNFDFVYYGRENEIIGVEETTFNAARGLAFFLEKRKFLDNNLSQKTWFIVSYENSRPDIDELLLKKNIIPINTEERVGVIHDILKNVYFVSMKRKIMHSIKARAEISKERSMNAAVEESNRPMDKYENMVNHALKEFDARGKMVLKTRNGCHFVPDNIFTLNRKNIAVTVSACKSRGSLFYAFYNHSSHALIYKEIFKMPTLSVIFDFSNSSASYSDNLPRNLWTKYCKYNTVIKGDNLKDLNKVIEDCLTGG